jgi:DNA-binding NtrC family response regulator
MDAPWPGNVRELNNFVKRFLIMGDEALAIEELSASQNTLARAAAASVGRNGGHASTSSDLKMMVRDLKDVAEMEAITRTLMQCGWNRKRAATVLKISYKALLYKVRQYNIRPPAGSSITFVDKGLS